MAREYDAMPEHIERQTAADYRREWAEAHGYAEPAAPPPPPPPAPPRVLVCRECGRRLQDGERCDCTREAPRG
jgi:hypothetical protein